MVTKRLIVRMLWQQGLAQLHHVGHCSVLMSLHIFGVRASVCQVGPHMLTGYKFGAVVGLGTTENIIADAKPTLPVAPRETAGYLCHSPASPYKPFNMNLRNPLSTLNPWSPIHFARFEVIWCAMPIEGVCFQILLIEGYLGSLL